MSAPKACDGVVLTPMKFAPQPVEVTVSKAKYLPPSARAAVKKEETLTKDDMDSTKLFPTLGGASTWKQLGSRFSKPLSEVVGNAIERERKAQEDGIREENETDPRKMKDANVIAAGWDYIETKETSECIIENDDDKYVASGWGGEITEMMMQQPEVFLKNIQCVNVDGTPLERHVAQKKEMAIVAPIVKTGSPMQQFWSGIKKA